MECRNVGLRAPRPKRSERVTVQCAHCGNDKQVTPSYVERTTSNTFFCSAECRNAYDTPIPRLSSRARTSLACSQCGAHIEVTPSRFANNKTGLFYCDDTCRRAHEFKTVRLPDRACKLCSTSFHSSDRTARFCSKECFDEWQARNRVVLTCEVCGSKFERQLSHTRTTTKWCSRQCRAIAETKTAVPGRWHNGKPVRKNADGYLYVWEPDHPDAHARGWMLEHRLVAEQKYGHRIPPDVDIHHVNGIKDDNRPDNLVALDPETHTQITLEESSMRRRAAQKRIRELEADNARIIALEAELTELRKRLE
jgi:HNH endonuclease